MARIEASLAAGGFTLTRDSVAGRQAVIARSGRFRRPRFVLIAVFKAGMAGRDHLDRFLDEAGQYAATVKAGPASGVSAVAVAVVESGSDAGWASTTPDRPAAGRPATFPVLVDVASSRVMSPDAPVELHRLVQEHVATALGL